MEKYYTISEVIDNMDFGEVAVKVDGEEDRASLDIGMYIFFDKNDDGILKNSEGNDIIIAKTFGKQKRDKYVIMDRNAFNRLKSNK